MKRLWVHFFQNKVSLQCRQYQDLDFYKKTSITGILPFYYSRKLLITPNTEHIFKYHCSFGSLLPVR